MRQLQDLTSLYDSLGLSDESRAYIEQARIESPTAGHSSMANNVVGNTVMRHMGTNMPFDSRTPEYYELVKLEFDDDVIEVWPQPPKRKITYVTANGRQVTRWKRHDFLVIRTDRIGWIECKYPSDLPDLEEKAPDLFCQEENGIWRSPACERDAVTLNFFFEVSCPTINDANHVRNADFLYNYMWREVGAVFDADIKRAVRLVQRHNYVTLAELLHQVSADSIYFAIATKQLYFNWHASLLRSPETTTIYSSAAYCQTLTAPLSARYADIVAPATFEAGTRLSWEGDPWQLLHIHDGRVSMVNADHRTATILVDDLRARFSAGEIRICSEPTDEKGDRATAFLEETSPSALRVALEHFEKFRRWENGETHLIKGRTARDWREKIRRAEVEYGMGVLGLVHQNARKGNRTTKANTKSLKLAEEAIVAHYEVPQKPSKHFAYGQYKNLCADSFVSPVSYSTFSDLIDARDDADQTESRDGEAVRYQVSGPLDYDELATPPNGDRAWEIGHIDHTQIELDTISTINSEPLGKPWLTYLFDAYTRKIFAMWLTFFKPSRIAVMMVMRDCVRRWGRLPDKIVVDRGSEFQSVYFDALLAKCNIKKFLRPKRAPRHGSVAERVFGTTDTNFTHQILGNTKHRRLFRSQSASHDPSSLAVWTPDAVYDELNYWSFDVYPELENRGIAESPNAKYQRSIAESGAREFMTVPFNDNFMLATMPESPFGATRKVSKGTITVDKLAYRGRQHSINAYNGMTGDVRVEPYNPSLAYMFLDGVWRELVCTNDLVREYMERGIHCSHMELSARLARSNKKYREIDPTLLKFLRHVNATQQDLIAEKPKRGLDLTIAASEASQEPPPLPPPAPMTVVGLEDEHA